MLDLDNLDLDLEDDFPIPFSGRNIFQCSSSLQSNETKTAEKLSNFIQTTGSNSTATVQPLIGNKQDKQIGNKLNPLPLDPQEHMERNINGINNKLNSTNFLNVSNTSLNSSKSSMDSADHNSVVSKQSTRRILAERKFPGPAGLLPDKPLKDLSDMNLILDNSVENVMSERQKESVILCSQPAPASSEASFKKLVSEFKLTDDNSHLVKYTVDWVKKKALKKSLFGRKIPFLGVILHHLDHSTPDPTLTLRDETGEILGTLHREVWSELGAKLHPGAAIALRQVGVLVTGVARRQIYLNVTKKNIVNIYSYEDENVVTHCINQLKSSDLILSVEENQIEASPPMPNLLNHPITVIGGKKPNHHASFTRSGAPKRGFGNNFQNSGDRTHPQSRLVTNSLESSLRGTSARTQAEDDFLDFNLDFEVNGFDESSFTTNDISSRGKGNLENSLRKRKSDTDDDRESGKLRRKHSEERPQRSDGPDMCFGSNKKFIVESQPLSQAESQIVEEVLNGIDFDDFDT